MKTGTPLLFLVLAGFACNAPAADNPRCIEQFKAEEARIMRDLGHAAAANPPGSDREAQRKLMVPVHDALKRAGERAEQCNRDSRSPPSADARLRLAQCADRADQQLEALRRGYANRSNLSRSEQMAIREGETRIGDERMNCMRQVR